MIVLFVPGERVAYVEDDVPHAATVLEVHRATCTVRLRQSDEVLTVPMSMLRTCPVTPAKCDDELPEDAA